MADALVLHLPFCRIGGIEMETKNRSINAIVNGYQVTFSFADKPKKDLEGKIRKILLDSFIAQNKGLIPQGSGINTAQEL